MADLVYLEPRHYNFEILKDYLTDFGFCEVPPPPKQHVCLPDWYTMKVPQDWKLFSTDQRWVHVLDPYSRLRLSFYGEVNIWHSLEHKEVSGHYDGDYWILDYVQPFHLLVALQSCNREDSMTGVSFMLPNQDLPLFFKRLRARTSIITTGSLTPANTFHNLGSVKRLSESDLKLFALEDLCDRVIVE